MNHPRFRALAMGAALALGAQHLPVHAGPQPAYSLKAVEANPIPRAEHFALWRTVALDACKDSRSRFNLDQTACSALISKRSEQCVSELESQSPTLIRTTQQSRGIGRSFLHCAIPYYFCQGVEVKTEAEARDKCR